jgi:uncharacterized membrane protein (UPF0127 family)
MVNFEFSYKGKKYKIDVEECKTHISQAHGLMFRKKSKPLLFIFKRSSRVAIHSFFCVPFVGIWFNGEKVVDIKSVKPWITSIKPKENFDKLLEVPINSRYYSVLSTI